MKPDTNLLPADWDVPQKLRARLGTSAGRQRLIHEDGHLLLVLHAPPGADDTYRRGRFFWRDRNGNWSAAPKSEHIANLDQHLNEYRTAIEKLEQDEDAARDARDYFDLLDRLAPLTRSTRNMYETLQEARETVRDDRELIVARDLAYELNRRADLLQQDAQSGLDFAVAWQAEQQAEASHQMAVATHRLNLLVAFFFPIATATAIFGANLRHGLEGWDERLGPLPLIAIIGVGLVIGLLLTAFVTSPAKRPHRDIRTKPKDSTKKRLR
jgi:hypothetical protein